MVPSISTGSKTATGFIVPVLETLQSTFINLVSTVSSFHLNAIECLGALAVEPKDNVLSQLYHYIDIFLMFLLLL